MAEVNSPERKKRVRLFKRIIIAIVVTVICLPILLSVILLFRLIRLTDEVEELKQKIEQLEQAKDEQDGQEPSSMARNKLKDVEQLENSGSEALLQAVSEKKTDQNIRKVYLTFDDGPSSNTQEILDILKQYDVKATFFVVAKENAAYDNSYKRIVEEGHTLGMHSYSHKYDEIYASVYHYKEDLSKLQGFLYSKTGLVPSFCRFPGGSSNTVSRVDMKELISVLNEESITYYDWNVESGDTTSGNISSDQIVENCMSRITQLNTSMILMHDASDKDSTVQALPILIEEILALDNTSILPITEETIPIQHIRYDQLN